VKVLILILAMAAGFALQNEGCVPERVAWPAVQIGQVVAQAPLEM